MQQRNGFIWLALAVITLVAYAPALQNEFVNYDDPDYVTANPHIQGGLTGESISWAFTTGHASNWHPLTWISHMVDYKLFGLTPGGHHLVNVLWHVANTLLLFAVLWRMTGGMWQSAFVAAAFAWHPLHVESVAWISERKDVLSAFFWLLTMGCYALHVRSREPVAAKGKTSKEKRESKGKDRKGKEQRQFGSAALWYGLTLFCFALGLMSKPMLVTLPFVLLLLDFWPLQRVSLFESGGERNAKMVGKLALEKVPLLVLAIISSVVTFIVQRQGGAVSSLGSLSVGQRVANALVSYLRYVGKLFWPVNLSVLYPHPGSWPWMLVAVAGVFLVVTSIVVLLQARQRPYLAVGWFWFVGTLVPVIGLVQVGVQSMADRYTYVPAIGLLIMLAWGMPELAARWHSGSRAMAFGAGMALALCILMTRAQEKYWRTSEQLFRHAVAVTKNNYLAYNNLGYFLDHDGKPDEALEYYRKSLEINPNYEEAQNNIGYVLAGKGRQLEAIPYYEKAVQIKPNLYEAHNNLGNALADIGKVDEAISHYEIVLKLKPDHVDAHNNYGIALAMKGKFDEATRHINEAIRLRPNYASAHSNLGNVLAAQHKLDEAAQQYQLALNLNPNDSQAHNNLGNVYSEQNKLDEAVTQYAKAIQLKANNPEAQFNYGMALLRQGKNVEALGHFREALRLKPDYADAQKKIAELEAVK